MVYEKPMLWVYPNKFVVSPWYTARGSAWMGRRNRRLACRNGQLRILRGHEAGVATVAFSLDGRRIVTGSYDGSIALWDGVPYSQTYRLRQALNCGGSA